MACRRPTQRIARLSQVMGRVARARGLAGVRDTTLFALGTLVGPTRRQRRRLTTRAS